MAIDDGTLRDGLRSIVTWFDVPVPVEAHSAFELREYAVGSCNKTQLQDPAFLGAVTAVVFTQSESNPAAIRKQVLQYAPMALDFGCNVIIRPAVRRHAGLLAMLKKTSLENIIGDSGKTYPTPYVRVDDEGTKWNVVADFVDKRRTGRAPDTRLIPELALAKTTAAKPLTAGATLLLQRAFADCEKLYLRPLDGGKSGAWVFIAYPTRKRQYYSGRWPTPCCVKIDTRAEIFIEYTTHRDKVDPYLPFHLGPHLIPDRCFLGATHGILVTDFVEESENFIECARAGRAGPAIAGLFNRTLHGWHRNATEQDRPLASYLTEAQQMPPARRIIAGLLGATSDQAMLVARLKKRPPAKTLAGPVHGDLNTGNILVRGADAVVIDFSKHRPDGALLCDAAALEASLVVHGFVNKDADPRPTSEWLHSIRPLYEASAFRGSLPFVDPHRPSYWFYECVRQIRRYSRQLECGKEQYATALAAAFLKLACKDIVVAQAEDEARASAFVLAEAILLGANHGSVQPSRRRQAPAGV